MTEYNLKDYGLTKDGTIKQLESNSIFTTLLNEVLNYYAKLENNTATMHDKLTLQQMEAAYTSAYIAKNLSKQQYRIINTAWHDLMNEYRREVK